MNQMNQMIKMDEDVISLESIVTVELIFERICFYIQNKQNLLKLRLVNRYFCSFLTDFCDYATEPEWITSAKILNQLFQFHHLHQSQKFQNVFLNQPHQAKQTKQYLSHFCQKKGIEINIFHDDDDQTHIVFSSPLNNCFVPISIHRKLDSNEILYFFSIGSSFTLDNIQHHLLGLLLKDEYLVLDYTDLSNIQLHSTKVTSFDKIDPLSYQKLIFDAEGFMVFGPDFKELPFVNQNKICQKHTVTDTFGMKVIQTADGSLFLVNTQLDFYLIRDCVIIHSSQRVWGVHPLRKFFRSSDSIRMDFASFQSNRYVVCFKKPTICIVDIFDSGAHLELKFPRIRGHYIPYICKTIYLSDYHIMILSGELNSCYYLINMTNARYVGINQHVKYERVVKSNSSYVYKTRLKRLSEHKFRIFYRQNKKIHFVDVDFIDMLISDEKELFLNDY